MSNKNKENNIEENTDVSKNGSKDLFNQIIVAFVIAIILKAFIVGTYKIPSGSMLETLQIGDYLIVNKLSYLFSDPKHDDVIVFEYPIEPNKNFIKRIIGIPGDKIKIVDKIVYRNGEALHPSYVKYDDSAIDPYSNIEEFVVPENKYLALGDNRDNSFDGRYWGFVDKKAIYGKAWIIYWSWGEDGPRFNRIFDRIK